MSTRFKDDLTSSLLLFFRPTNSIYLSFGRITASKSKGRDSWYHETFIRGCPEKLPGMSRTKRKGKFSRQASTSTHSAQLSSQGSTDSLDMHVEEEVLQGSECGSLVTVDTVQVSNGTNHEVCFSYDVFDEVEALFPNQEFSQNVERLITNDEGCTKTVNKIKMMPFRPQVSNSDDHQESDPFKLVNHCGATWDAMLIEIEPLPINCFNVLGSDESQIENADLDDFQKFLGRLIK